MDIPWISAAELDAMLSYSQVIDALDRAFRQKVDVPERAHFDLPSHDGQPDSTLLLMPAWHLPNSLGVKLVTITPGNAQRELPSIQGVYVLFDPPTGRPILLVDAPHLTTWRTAATSALAARYLARPDTRSLLMVGTGNLAPELVKAHATVFPLEQIWVWGRSQEKADRLVGYLGDFLPGAEVKVAPSLDDVASGVDLISTATLSPDPLITGELIRPGQHLDLVGAFKPSMRETDDGVVQQARIFVDECKPEGYTGGDLAIPIREGVIGQEAVEADLFDLCNQRFDLKRNKKDITLFKSVGHALEDLAVAELVLDLQQRSLDESG